ncbi:hypothetical protein [Mucilaginibacter antarcticus]|uniref:Lipocalin-like protein n=1 Tax=Mucilaginibacter antarcticus TaxID=1855725 RepID=A0ABW5XKU1_9SPHI
MKNLLLLVLASLVLASCGASITPETLHGKWKYTRVRNPKASPPDSVSSVTLGIEKPYIEFTNKDSLIIHWDGRVLSHGTYKLEGRNIIYKEVLADNSTREFPFYIENVDGKQMMFTTKGEDGSEVTAVKQ